jgi:subtilase family serine protease
MGLFALTLLATIPPANIASNIYIPPCSIARPGDLGKRVHTNYEVNLDPLPGGGFGWPGGLRGPAMFFTPNGYAPSDIQGAYGDVGSGGGTIAIVDAYDDPDALVEFNTFSSQFGLPQETGSGSVFQVAYAQGSEPPADGGWAGEIALDIEWAHAMAPGAKILLVESADNSWANMLASVSFAVATPGVAQVSMSWAGGDFADELGYDTTFSARSVRFFAASGDGGAGVSYPAASPNVIGCGGTSLTVVNGVYQSESGWAGSGGGPSAYEPRPSYQNSLSGLLGNARGVPDIAAVADPNTGVAVCAIYANGGNGWSVFGGTSVATPVLAGITNASMTIHRSSEWTWIYNDPNLFRDITTGNNGYAAGVGYDFVTGMGSPKTAQSL